MKPTLKKYLLYGSAIIIGGALLFVLIQTVRAKNTGFETKTLWDWMELFVIPLVLALGAFFLNQSERTVERQIAENRAKLEREIATDRQQEAALQSYLDRMTELLLKEKLQTSKDEEVRNVARIRTLTVLRGLDAKRKGMILLFLRESGLINKQPVINLTEADLSGAILWGADLNKVNLSDADLSKADLSDANLGEAYLDRTNLSDATLWDAYLGEAKLWNAYLAGAYLARANLSEASLVGAHLNRANMMESDLTGADLRDADLSEANLTDAKVLAEQLAIAGSLRGAIMPDGTKHD